MIHKPTEPKVTLTLDGTKYDLLFSLEAIATAEDASGMPLITGLRSKDINAPRISMIRALLWACMLPNYPKTTREEAAGLVTQWNWRDVWEKVVETWVAGMRKPQEGTAADPTDSQS